VSRPWALVVLFAAGLGAVLVPPATATAPQTDAAGAVLRVGVVEGSPPCSDRRDDAWQGLAPELWNRVASRESLAFRLSAWPSTGDLLEATRTGVIDVAVGCINVSPERLLRYRFSLPFQEDGLAVLVLRTPLDLGRAFLGALIGPGLLQLLGGYLLPILPLAAVAVLRWRTLPRRLFALLSLVLGIVALVLTYSRGAWMGMVASLGLLGLLLAMRQTRHWPLFWRRTLPLLLLVAAAVALVVLVTQVEPLRVRVMSLVAGREDSSNNFRINVWTSVLAMINDRPWLGIGPGNTAFNLIYPLYQQPKFNALSAYSIPLELLVEAGVPGLLAGLALLFTAMRTGLLQGQGQGMLSLPSLAAVAAFAGLAVQGLTDTIFFRPEVQLVALFSLATLAAAAGGEAGTAAAASPLADARLLVKARSGAAPGA